MHAASQLSEDFASHRRWPAHLQWGKSLANLGFAAAVASLLLVASTSPAVAQQTLAAPLFPQETPTPGSGSETYSGPPAGIDGPAKPRATARQSSSQPPPGIDTLPPPVEFPGQREPRQTMPLESLPLESSPEGFPGSPLEIGEGNPLIVNGELMLDEEYYATQPQKLADYRNGFFQKLALSGNWIVPGDGGTDIGSTEIDTYLTVALPFPIVEWPLLVSPGYNMILLEGPTSQGDLPPRLHATYVDFTWLPTILARYRLLLAVTPGIYSDFEASNSDALRITGKAIVLHDLVPDRLQLVGGVIYLDRDNLKLLPAGGVIWKPTDWLLVEALFPKPKIATRWNVGQGYEDWLFVTAEFGGNTYAIIRDDGTKDSVTYADYRLLTGFERKLNGGAGYRFEAGYLFGRDVEYTSGQGNFSPGNTFMLRAGITF